MSQELRLRFVALRVELSVPGDWAVFRYCNNTAAAKAERSIQPLVRITLFRRRSSTAIPLRWKWQGEILSCFFPAPHRRADSIPAFCHFCDVLPLPVRFSLTVLSQANKQHIYTSLACTRLTNSNQIEVGIGLFRESVTMKKEPRTESTFNNSCSSCSDELMAGNSPNSLLRNGCNCRISQCHFLHFLCSFAHV